MSDKLVEFATALDQDPALQQQYFTDPLQTLKEFGVDDSDIELILNDDTGALKTRLEMSGLKAITIVGKPK